MLLTGEGYGRVSESAAQCFPAYHGLACVFALEGRLGGAIELIGDGCGPDRSGRVIGCESDLGKATLNPVADQAGNVRVSRAVEVGDAI